MRESNPSFKSSTPKTRMMGFGVLALGALSLALAHRAAPGTKNADLVEIIGNLLLFLGVVVIVFVEDIQIEADQSLRILRVEKKSLLGTRRNRIPFAAIEGIRIRSLSRRGSPTSYFIVLSIKDGTSLQTGHWGFDQEDIQRNAETLAATIGCPVIDPNLKVYPLNTPVTIAGYALHPMFISSVIAIAVYAAYYRVQVGEWCPAMWFGTAPALIMGLSFCLSLGVLRRIPRL